MKEQSLYTFSGERFARRLRLCRLERNYTQEQLAAKAGLTPRQIRRYESNEQSPSVEHLEAIRIAFQIPLWQLLDMDYEVAVQVFGLQQDAFIPPTVEMKVLLQAIADRFDNLEQQIKWLQENGKNGDSLR